MDLTALFMPLFEGASMGMASLGPDGSVQALNGAARRRLGLLEDQARPMWWTTFLQGLEELPRDRETTLMLTGAPDPPCRLRLTPCGTSEGAWWLGTVLEGPEADGLWSDLVDALPCGVAQVVGRDRVVRSNPAWTSLAGETFPLATLWADLPGGTQEERHIPVPHPLGSTAWLEATVRPMADGASSLVVVQDVTYWRSVVEANIRMESLLRSALDIGHLTWFTVEGEGCAWLQDPNLTALLGTDPGTHARFCAEVEGHLGEAAFRFLFQVPASEGQPERWLVCRGESVALPGHEHPLLVGLIEDVTPDHREATLARERATHQAKGRMAAYLAHEVNNPLGGVKNAALLIRRFLEDPTRQERYLDLLDQGVARIQEVIRSLVDLYQPLQPTDILDVREWIQELQRLVARPFEARGLTLEVTLTHGVLLPSQEGEILRQVAFNLLQNAAEASPPGGKVSLILSFAEQRLVLEVLDEGPGIPLERQAELWTSGYSTKRATVTGGLTLGLALSRSLLRDLGGDLVLAPPCPGRGAHFSIMLPLASMKAADPSSPSAVP